MKTVLTAMAVVALLAAPGVALINVTLTADSTSLAPGGQTTIHIKGQGTQAGLYTLAGSVTASGAFCLQSLGGTFGWKSNFSTPGYGPELGGPLANGAWDVFGSMQTQDPPSAAFAKSSLTEVASYKVMAVGPGTVTLKFQPDTNYISMYAPCTETNYAESIGTLTSVTITVTGGSGSPPIAQNSTVSATSGVALTITMQASDDGVPGPLSYIITSLPTHGGLKTTGGASISTVPYTVPSGSNKVVYTSTGYSGSDSFYFKANDGGTPPSGGDSNGAAITVNVTLPQPPVAQPGGASAYSGSPVTVTLAATDDGLPSGTLTYIITSLPTHGGLKTSSGTTISSVPYTLPNNQVVYTATAGYGGSDSFGFKANDGGTAPTGGDSNVATITVTVTATQPPVAQEWPYTAYTGSYVYPTLIVSDDGQPNPPGHLSYIICTLPTYGTLRDTWANHDITPTDLPYTMDSRGGTPKYTPNVSYAALDVFTWKANDGGSPPYGGDSNVARVKISVGSAGGNWYPMVFPTPKQQTVTRPAAASLTGTGFGNDTPPELFPFSFNWTKLSGPGIVTFSNPNSLLTSATFGAGGVYVLQVQMTQAGLSDFDTVTVNVNAGPNTAPIVDAGPDQMITLPASASLNGTASDDNQPQPALTLTWSKLLGPGTVSFANANALSTTATFSVAGTYILQLAAYDGALTTTDTVTVRVRSTGRVHTVGSDDYGRLGIGLGTEWNANAALIGNVTTLTSGYHHTLAVKSDGTLWAWGYNASGQLGNGTSYNSSSPVQVPGLSSVLGAAAGYVHSLAIAGDGSVWAWGDNSYGQLGNGTTASSSVPVKVSDLDHVVAVAAGAYHSLALKDDGTVWAWGYNASGQLGNGTITNSSVPVKANLDNVTAVSAGAYHSLALKNDRTARAWGSNSYGQLGNGTTASSNLPVLVSVLTNITSLAAGPASNHNLAVDTNGQGWAWGSNSYGQLGDGTTTNRSTPQQVSGLTSTAWVAAGGSHSLAVMSDGTAKAWGWSYYGQLGDGSITWHTTPSAVPGLPGVTTVGAGSNNSLALAGDGTVWGWGYNAYGQLGDGARSSRSTPVQVSDLTGIRVAGGADHSLLLTPDGNVLAWGSNSSGQLGDGTSMRRHSPVAVSDLASVVAISAGDAHSLAVKSDGTAWAWGQNGRGELGTGTGGYSLAPVQITALADMVDVSAGWFHSLGLKRDGTVWAWGDNTSGALGDNTTTGRLTPVQVSNLTGVIAVAASHYFSLALKSDGTVYTWGDNTYSTLGAPVGEQHAPMQVPGLTGVVAIAAGYYHCLALDANGHVWAWGSNTQGQLGDGSSGSPVNTPEQLPGLANVVAVTAGEFHSVAIKDDGTAWAWGYNVYGQVGDGTYTNRTSPVQVSGLTGVKAASAGYYHNLFLADAKPAPVPQVAGTWPVGGSAERTVTNIIVGFDWPMANVTADDLVLSAGSVVSVQGSGKGAYVFTVTGLPDGSVTATIDGNIASAGGVDLPACTWTFQNCLPPPPPPVGGPGDGTIDLGTGASLSWGSGAAGVTYDVYLDTANPPVAKVASGLTDATFTPGSLQMGTRYYWRIVANGPGGQTTGPVWSFATHLLADANGDGYVNVLDLQAVVGSWASSSGGGTFSARADLNDDGYVNVGDLQILVANWGRSLN